MAYTQVRKGRRGGRGNVQEKEEGKSEETVIIKRGKWTVKRTTKRGMTLQNKMRLLRVIDRYRHRQKDEQTDRLPERQTWAETETGRKTERGHCKKGKVKGNKMERKYETIKASKKRKF